MLANVSRASYQHKFCAERGLDDGKAKVIIRDTLRLQHRGFEEDHSRKADVEIDREDGELDQFFADFLAERGVGVYSAFRRCIRLR